MRLGKTETFKDFVLLKAYDVVSAGQFRKHLSASKERGDAWACAMQAHHNSTSDTIKELLASLLSLKDDHFRDLQVFCPLYDHCPPFAWMTTPNTAGGCKGDPHVLPPPHVPPCREV